MVTTQCKTQTSISECSYMSQTVVPLGYDTMPDTDVDLRVFIHESDSSTTMPDRDVDLRLFIHESDSSTT